ncbi:ribonuclease H2 subunit A [Achlya hypogyna]|uniref:Ribonuclease H2 subunit A n=1 Tax=Achlya hypogyna TaxID=1202772 RepID=A0A1V9Z7I6_ACHHY|nr:ribonuclease H2 subunit A [Achlya hypogyna]
MADVVLRRGELLHRRMGQPDWQRCWIRMYADRAVDHLQATWLLTKQVVRVEPTTTPGPSQWMFTVTIAGGVAMEVCVASQDERDGWIRCLLDAKRSFLAENGKLLFQAAHSPATNPTFVRFADSDSDVQSSAEDESLSDEEVVSPGHVLTAPANTPRRPIRDRPRILTIIHVTMETKQFGRFVAPIALDDDGLATTVVYDIKKEALAKLKHRVLSSLTAADVASDSMLRDLVQDDRASFVLVLPDAVRDVWLRNDDKPLQYYVDMKLDKSSDTVHLSMVPVETMPPPPLQVSITGNTNKVSDLSQKVYTAYTIQVSYNDVQWTVNHRFKDFAALDAAIKTSPCAAYLPPLPKKKAITPKTGSFVAKRQRQLQAYLEEVVALPGLVQNIHLMTFLGVVSTARNRELERSVLHVSAVHACLSYGDIILFKTRFGASKVQRKITGARYDHAGIVVPGSTPPLLSLLEATGEGIQVYALKPRLQAYGREVTNAIVARRITALRTAATLAKVQEFVLGVEGNAYSIFGILNRSKVDKEEKTTKYFCSELVAAALMHLGWLRKDLPPSYYWPGNFQEGGELEVHLEPGVTIGPELALDCKFLEVGRAQ